MKKTVFGLEATVPEEDVDLATAVLALHFPYGWEEKNLPDGRVTFQLHSTLQDVFDELVPRLETAVPSVELKRTKEEAEDWTMAWRRFFTPVSLGRFIVIPPWLREETNPERKTPIIIEPASAFGTGHHASTELCLEIISGLLDSQELKPGMEILDLGTGTGILAIALAGQGLRGLALDIEPVAVANAEENVTMNNVKGLEIIRGGIEKAEGRHFDFIVANILADVLKNIAEELHAALRPGGKLVLSGILDIQANSVEERYAALGMPPAERTRNGEWTALLFRKK